MKTETTAAVYHSLTHFPRYGKKSGIEKEMILHLKAHLCIYLRMGCNSTPNGHSLDIMQQSIRALK